MISNTFQANTFTGGLDLDTDINLLPDNKYRYAENIRIVTNDGGSTGILQNIDGAEQYISYIPTGEVIIGTVTVNNIGIVITKVSATQYNKIYRITGFDTNTPTITVILQGDLQLCLDLNTTPNLSVVANYETDTNIKIYFTDGTSSVKMLNVVDNKYVGTSSTNPLVDINGNILNPKAIDITPGAVLQPLTVTDLTVGNLPAGSIQYCYQLFNLHGSETPTASLSNIMHLTVSTTNQDSQVYEGTTKGSTSAKGCVLSIPINNHDFDRCRIISILYLSNNTIPVISIVDELLITPSDTLITYTDTGNNALGEISIDEFNQLTGYQFIAATLGKKDNRLFTADITDITWNPDTFDARAYRSNLQGIIKLEDSDSSDNLYKWIDTSDLSLIPKTHDCINPFNRMTFAQSKIFSLVNGLNVDGTAYSGDYDNNYVYGKSVNGSRYYGGHGVNIDYNFITVPLKLSEAQAQNRLNNNCSMNVPAESTNSMLVTNVGSNSTSTIMFPASTYKRIPNYADPYIASRFKNYQRDEVYRFGIIFYNDKNIPSPVYWIGDIRIPHASETGFEPFYYDNTSHTLMARALGIKFTVRNIPNGSTGYEIVRCDRTDSDRTVITQGILSNIGEYRIQETDGNAGSGTVIDSSIESRPPVILSYTSNHTRIENRGRVGEGGNLPKSYIRSDYAKFISPEISLIQEDSEKYFKDNIYIDSIYAIASLINNADVTPNASRNFATANKILSSDGTEKSIVYPDLSIVGSYISTDSAKDIPNGDLVLTQHFSYEPYAAYIAKYYMINCGVAVNKDDNTNSLPITTINILDAKYTGDIPYNGFQSVLPYRINVGNITYTNFGMSSFNETGGDGIRQPVTGPSGPGLILYAPGLNTSLPRFGTMSYQTLFSVYQEDSLTAVPVVNIKRSINQYGGDTYTSRQNSIYIGINEYIKIPSNYWTLSGSQRYLTNYAYGGDTYLNLLDYPITMTFQANDENYWQHTRKYIGAYIPLESSINMNLFNGDMAHRSYRSGDNYLDSHLEMDITQKGTYHVQDKPYFLYNTAYSTQQGSKKYIPNTIYAENNVRTFNRILSSQAKTNNEIIDNWTKFKIADYLDVDNQYGKITNLYTFKDRLFFWQDTSMGIAAVNERSLITDNNVGELTLGTGGILTRYDYLTSTNGSSIKNDRSICNSNSSLYWYDYDKNEICTYDGSVRPISKLKTVQSYLNTLYNNKSKDTLGFYNKKYNEVWFRFYDKSLIFNEQLDAYTSFYTFNPKEALQFSDKIIGLKDNKLYTINSLGISGMTKVDTTAKIELIVNKDIQYTKVFDNVRLQGNFITEDEQILTNIGQMKFDTKHQTSGNLQNIVFDYREDTYRFALPRANEVTNDLSYPSRLRGKYLICNYVLNTNNSSFAIPQITTTYRYSLI